jgi:DNA-binding LytR/AlgR family response regulator
LEVAGHLTNKLIIFTTAHKEFAAEAFDLNAIDYIRKPIQKDRFEKAIEKALRVLEFQNSPEKSQTLWNTDKGREVLNFKDVLYITSSDTHGRDKLVYLQNGTKTTIKNTSFEQILTVLPMQKFCRINKKDVLALKTVQHFTADEITTNISIKGGEALVFSLSDVYSNEFKEKIKSI